MSLLDRLAEAHIEAAVERGELDDLPGHGRPLPHDDARAVPAHLRAGYRLLKNAGFVPPEIQTRRELREVEDLLSQSLPDSDVHHQLRRRARWLEIRLGESRRGRALLREPRYGGRIRARLTGTDDNPYSRS